MGDSTSTGGGLIGLLGAVVSIWALLHMDQTHAFFAGIGFIPDGLASWLAWGVIIYGGLNAAVIGIIVLVVVGFAFWKLAEVTAR